MSTEKKYETIKRIKLSDGKINFDARQFQLETSNENMMYLSINSPLGSTNQWGNNDFDEYVKVIDSDEIPVAVDLTWISMSDAATIVELLLSFDGVRNAVDDSIPTTTLKMTAKELEVLQKVELESRKLVGEVLTKDELKVWESLSDLINLKGGEK